MNPPIPLQGCSARTAIERNIARPLCLLLVLAISTIVFGQEGSDSAKDAATSPVASIDSKSQEDQFENHIRPLLSKNCLSCHGQGKREGSLDLSSIDGILRGGDSGPAIVSGKPEESLLMEAVRHQSLEMPPDRELDKPVIEQLSKWIGDGAYWPSGQVLKTMTELTEQDRQWWCIQPIQRVTPPAVLNAAWCRNEVDNFILHRLESEGFGATAEASAVQLYRRVHFTLTGLPPERLPTAEQLAEPNWYDALVDRLLGDQAYGENQARFWLDLVRYADSDGYRADAHRPAAQQYRDYVIASFNNDKPYDRFVMEQIAGDEIDPNNREAIIGTMYLRHWIYEHNQRDVEGQWQEILDDVTETTADAFLALGLKCARCHDHKYDPLLQKDFFRLQAFFAAMHPREDLPIASPEQREQYNQQYEAWDMATRQLRLDLFQIENPPLLAHATREGFDKFVPEIKAMILKQPYQRTPHEHQIATLAQRQYDLLPEKLPEWLDKDKLAARQQLLDQLASYDASKPKPLPLQQFVMGDVGPVAPDVFIVGDATKTPVAPGPPSIMEKTATPIIPPHSALQSTGRRTALAKWIASPDNPLTARVVVNRIWEQHFGVGLAENASDFGRLGEQPSHPELLDWLAQKFIDDGWSIKNLHRRILTSATYRQSCLLTSSTDNQTANQNDPSNRLLWRMNPRRLSGEEIVDAMQFVSGELRGNTKRAIYERVMRNNLHPIAGLFDYPDRIRSVSKRHRTTTSTQALLLMNNDWVRQRSIKVFERYMQLDSAQFVAQVHQQLFSRIATDEEVAAGLDFIQRYADASIDKNTSEETPAVDVTVDPSKQVTVGDATSEPIVGASGKPAKSDSKGAKPEEKSDTKPNKGKSKAAEPSLSKFDQARVALIHALLSSNEMIYID